MEYRVVTRGGEVVWLRDMARLVDVRSDGCQVWHGVQFDITAEKTAETQLQRLAFYDALTGLPNRRLCIDRIESVLNASGRPEVALLFIDLDRFKFINDGIGHAAGDELLVAVARRLADHVAAHGSLARFGGDEFVAVLVDTPLCEVEALAGTLLSALRHPFRVDGYELDVEGTIGIAVASPKLQTPEALLRAADVALYRAKADGRGGYAIYDPRIDEQSPDRFEREAELRRALASHEFNIAYQPVVDIETRQIVAVEALLRWNHPERGFLESSEFIELVDQTGLIIPIGKWVIEEACRQMRHWQDLYPAVRSLLVSVNLSGRQFRQASLATDVALVLRQTGLSPQSLALEIKEGDALADSKAIAATLQEFRRLGVRVTIDDFGKGWSALGSLTRFTIDDLKIDGSCVSRLGREQQDIDVVRALVGMAKAMGLDVTAGAVETGEQLAMLREIGCDRAQGRHLAPPLMADELERLFQRADEFGLRPSD
jgi:diguanylate cyclase (GGDEF)-like protein